ncbi:MAG: uracil-DNA glycosylase [Acidiferrobacterales bacterium]
MPAFNPHCRACPRLARHLANVRKRYPQYYARPVAPFGDSRARLLIVGLAPGMHGANASGRPFTGDFAGIMLYETLYDYGFASASRSLSADDDLLLTNCRITNAVKCLPPENKPTTEEVHTCNQFLRAELDGLAPGSVILALGVIAHKAVIRAFGLKQAAHRFTHGRHHRLPNNQHLLDCYHCSRYNTQTGRLTKRMFRTVFRKATTLLAR